ncbi:MAG: hypothetical protein JXA68_01060 [Ignavibacteriales bacterium]|nr:hypothetical protein [Ignavibacteriales bacterium]
MFDISNIEINLSADYLLVIGLLLVSFIYTLFIYKYTIPQISKPKKIFLITLRIIVLLLLVTVIFEPVVNITRTEKIEPINLVYIDNSQSITFEDSLNKYKNILNALERINNSINCKSNTYIFGSKIKNATDSLDLITFKDNSTNFTDIINSLQNDLRNIASVVIISDGTITDGSNPIHNAEKLNIPIFTIGIGDTTKRKDVEISKVLYNENVFLEKSTKISTTIIQNGFDDAKVQVSFWEDKTQIIKKEIILSKDGINNIEFDYVPKSAGEKKISIIVSNQQGELTYANNKNIFFINVLDDKVKILVLSSSPSADVSFITNSLKADENLEVISLIQISKNEFLNNKSISTSIDSADAIFLVGFPGNTTTSELLNVVQQALKEKPFFLTLSTGTDLNRLKQLEQYLPFTITQITTGLSPVQPNIEDKKNSLLTNNAPDPVAAWSNLPPIFQTNSKLNAKPESNVIATSKIRNVPMNTPLIVSKSIGYNRVIAVLGQDIWKWKLQVANKELNLFDNFIYSCVRWMTVDTKRDRFKIKTQKKLYVKGELVEFVGEVYDESFNPLDDVYIKVIIKKDVNISDIKLNSIGNGIYESTYETNKEGDYQFSAVGTINGKTVGKSQGRFTIGDINIETINPRLDKYFLSSLSYSTNGKYYDISNLDNLLKEINQKIENSTKEKIKTSEINLWSDELLLILIITLFSLEWFFRKKFGML